MARILVAEDQLDIGLLIKTLLEDDGHSVSLVADGEEALAALRASPPDLLVTDVMMPRMDGFTLCGRMQEESSLRGIPVVIVTAKGQLREPFKAFPNAVTFLDKPFNRVVLTGMVERALRKKD